MRNTRTTGRRRALTTGIVAGAALVLAACGGEDTDPATDAAVTADDTVSDADDDAGDDAGDDDTADADDAGVEADDDADDGAAAADADDATPGDAAAGDALTIDEVVRLLQDAHGTAAQVTYDVEFEGPLTTMTLAQDPPRSAMLLDSAEGEFRIITDGDETTSCMQMGGEWQCFTQTLDSEFAEGLLDLPGIEDTDPEDVAEDETPDRIESTTVLDRDAVCLWFDESDGAIDVRVCFDTETGIVLLSTGTSPDGEEFRLEAVEVGDVDPAMFELPAEPMDFDLGELGDLGEFDADDFDPGELPDFGN